MESTIQDRTKNESLNELKMSNLCISAAGSRRNPNKNSFFLFFLVDPKPSKVAKSKKKWEILMKNLFSYY
jgi:hypothetical protein